MKLAGLSLAVLGWLIPVAGLTWTSSMGVRLVLCLVGAVLCGVGILGFLNGAYLKKAVWKE